MSELERLRGQLTDHQRELLTAIWRYFNEQGHWIPVRVLHQTFGGKPKVRDSLEPLRGSIVFEDEQAPHKYYRLTFLGILLTEDGVNCQELLAKYLEYISHKCANEPTRTHVNSDEVAADLGLDPRHVYLLGFLIAEGHFFSGTRSVWKGGWNVQIPEDVEDFPPNLIEYVHQRAMENYDPAVPIANIERSTYLLSKMNRSSWQSSQPEAAIGDVHTNYVDETRIAELKAIDSSQFDLRRLIRLCEELNICYSNECYLAVTMLTRALLDHVPPIFEVGTFSEVVNNYKGGKSFKGSMEHLEKSCRNISNAHLHVPIRRSETLPTKTQVDFSSDVDVLLAEIVRLLHITS